MKCIKLPLLFFAIVITQQLSAQTKWSLEDCISYAHANNLQIKQTQLQASKAEINVLQSKTNTLPDLNMSIGRNYRFGRQVDPFTNTFIVDNSISDEYSISSSLMLFNGLQNYNNIQAAKYAALAAYSNIEKEKIKITLDLASAYLQILFNDELLAVARNQRDVTALQVDRTIKLVDAGSVAKGQLLEIEAQLAAEDLNVTNALNSYNLSVLNLTQILDLDSVGGFDIVKPDSLEPDFSKPITDVLTVYNESLLILPHIKSAEYDLKSNERALAVVKGKRSPTLYLSGSIYTGYSDQRTLTDLEAPYYESPIGYLQSDPSQLVVTQGQPMIDYKYRDQFNDNIAQSVYLGVNIPILNRWEVNNNISRAKIQLEESSTNLDLVKQQLYKEIQQSYNDAVSSQERYKSALEAVDSYKEAFIYTEQKFNVGIVNSVEYNIAKNNYIKAESELLKAKYNYVFAIKILDFYRGVPITL